MEAKIYNQKGNVAGEIKLPKKVFGAPWRSDLVHQVVEGMRSNKRAGTADTKDRGEVEAKRHRASKTRVFTFSNLGRWRRYSWSARREKL